LRSKVIGNYAFALASRSFVALFAMRLLISWTSVRPACPSFQCPAESQPIIGRQAVAVDLDVIDAVLRARDLDHLPLREQHAF
jgi:hypothetical protein